MIEIRKTNAADSRNSRDKSTITVDDLRKDSEIHIQDVQKAAGFFADMLRDAARKHDHTKIEFIEQFYSDFVNLKPGKEFKSGKWWKKHLTERHHLMDRVPDDVNLIDVLEMVCDCVCAWKARSTGSFEMKDLPVDVLKKALENTFKLLISEVK